MATVIMYSTAFCPYCVKARALLDSKNISYQDIRVDEEPSKRDEMISKSGRRTVPQIFINNHPIGGYDDLYALNSNHELDNLLRK